MEQREHAHGDAGGQEGVEGVRRIEDAALPGGEERQARDLVRVPERKRSAAQGRAGVVVARQELVEPVEAREDELRSRVEHVQPEAERPERRQGDEREAGRTRRSPHGAQYIRGSP
jgi:hypothetical protein